MNATNLIIAVLALGLSACSLFRRSEASGYAGYENTTTPTEEYFREKSQYEEQLALEELGFESKKLSENESQALSLHLAVKRAEKNLNSERERTQYYGLKPFMSDRERHYFLSLPSVEARERWTQAQGIASRNNHYSPVVTRMIEQNDVTLGMTKKAVMESWGDPDQIESAGNPMYENERWRYNRTVSSTDGFNREQRLIYFESGRVVGWESK